MAIKRFNFDRWELVDLADLKAEDQIIYGGQHLSVAGPAFEKDGKVHLPTNVTVPGPLRLEIGGGAMAEFMDMCGTDLYEFGDGTAMLTSMSEASGYVFSPRLTNAELGAFCEEHREKYQAHYVKHRDQIDQCEPVEMERWWA